MAKDHWIRMVTVTTDDLLRGDWNSRDRNPIALAIGRVLRPGVTLFVDVGAEEMYLVYGNHRQWYGLPEDFRHFANRVCEEGWFGEFAIPMRFPPWSLVTSRSLRREQRHEEDSA